MADVHLGVEPDKGRPWGEGRGRQIWEAFAQAVEAAEKEQVDLVLIAGDLFHRQPLKKELKEANEILSRLTRAKVVIMAGNHDYLSPKSAYRTFSWNENVFFFSSEQPKALSFPELGATVWGFSYEHREIRESRYDSIPKKSGGGIHILLGHGGDEKHIPLKIKSLQELEFDYIALGHIHKPCQLVENEIVMAGSLQPLEHPDRGSRGYWITEIKRGKTRTYFHPLPGWEYVELEVVLDEKDTNYRIQSRIQEQLQQLTPQQAAVVILRGFYDPEVKPDMEAIEALDRVAAVEMLCRPKYDFERLKQEYSDQIIGRFIRRLESMPQEEAVQRALYLGMDALMGNEDEY